jgi:hypothetical protein
MRDPGHSHQPPERRWTVEHFNLIDRLHTDVLEDRYGPISARVVHHDSSFRVAHLVDSHLISRTLAITLFPPGGHNSAIGEVDEAIRAGGAIGKMFREHGYAIRKNVIDVDVLELPRWVAEAFVTESSHAKARYSEFLARRGSESPHVYGVVVEIYHPDFRPPEVNAVDRLQEAPTVNALTEQGVSVDEIWARLESGSPFDRSDERYQRAYRASRREVFLAEERIEAILQKGDAKR